MLSRGICCNVSLLHSVVGYTARSVVVAFDILYNYIFIVYIPHICLYLLFQSKITYMKSDFVFKMNIILI